jgi:hypothetical protein
MNLKKLMKSLVIFFLAAPMFAQPVSDINPIPNLVEYR